MKCPRCENELRRNVKDPTYGMCDNCKKKYRWIDDGAELLSENTSKSKVTKNPKKLKKWQTALIAIIWVAIIAGLLGNLNNDKDNSTEKNETSDTASKTDANGWTDNDYAQFMMVTEKISDDYVSNYEAPWGKNDWSFAKFDDNGNIIANTKYAFKNSNEKQDVICVFHLEGDKIFGHYLSVGDKVYLNDGTCDEALNNLNEIVNQ